MMRVLKSRQFHDCTVHIIGDTQAEIIVRVTDRFSPILHRNITETALFAAVAAPGQGNSSVERLFHRSVIAPPILVLPTASLAQALEAVA